MPTSKLVTPRYKAFEGLNSPQDRMLVARYGVYARPAIDSYSTKDDEVQASVFRYVLESYLSDRFIKGIDDKLQLYKCLTEALRIGDGNIFRYVAKSIEVITKAHKYGWAYPAAVMLLAEYYPKLEEKNKALWEGWGEDMIPTATEILTKHGSKSSVRHLQRIAEGIGIDFRGELGRPAIKKALPAKALPAKAIPAKAIPAKATPTKATPKKDLPKKPNRSK
jgi:hypothetical protein